MTLIDWDDFVPKGSNEFEPHFKSNPYLDRRIFQNNLDKGDFIVYKQADIYALTLVVLFCIVKEDFMDQNMVKKLHDKDGLKNYIDSLEIEKDVRVFMKKGTGIDGDENRFKNVSDFNEYFEKIKRIRPKKPNKVMAWLKKKLTWILAIGLVASLLFTAFAIDSTNKLKEQSASIQRINKKFARLQEWHLQNNDISKQISYLYGDTSRFSQKVKEIVEAIEGFSKNSANSVKFESLIPNNKTKTYVSTNDLKYNGIDGDTGTIYNPTWASIDLTHRSSRGSTIGNFGRKYNNVINELSAYLGRESEDERNKERKNWFLNRYFDVPAYDDEHLITLIYLGYSGTGGKSFMLRYPSYYDPRSKNTPYKLTERQWWKNAVDPINHSSSHGLTPPYVDTRASMPQPRTFWYRITQNQTDTLVLGIDFIFVPISN